MVWCGGPLIEISHLKQRRQSRLNAIGMAETMLRFRQRWVKTF